MQTPKSHYSLKVGLLIVAISYFLFTFHAVFTLQWIGEWLRGGHFHLETFIEDIVATPGMVLRLVGGAIALASVVYYFRKPASSTHKMRFLLRLILTLEGIYWLTLLPSAVFSVRAVVLLALNNQALNAVLYPLVEVVIPTVVESAVLPVALLILVYSLNTITPQKKALKWGLITGTLYVVVFWLLNSGMWVLTLTEKSTSYLISYPQNLLSFGLTVIGLAALAVYTGFLAESFSRSNNPSELSFKKVGAVVTALGMYFLWNYLSFIFFGAQWSEWYAWFLGHNLDLWMLSLPLLGLPLMLSDLQIKDLVSQV